MLDVGCATGLNAEKISKKVYFVNGIDISHVAIEGFIKSGFEGKQCDIVIDGIPYDDNYFDIVIVSGALQYLFDISKCMNEVSRVLKPGGSFIVAQRNHYSLSNMTSIRNILRTFIHFIFQEEHELHPSYKSMLVESRLGKLFKKFENKDFMNSSFMLKGHDKWKYKIDKKKITSPILTKLLKVNKFSVVEKLGSYYCFS